MKIPKAGFLNFFLRRQTLLALVPAIAVGLTLAFPGLAPLATFGLTVYLLGSGMFSFFVATIISLTVARLYPFVMGDEIQRFYAGGTVAKASETITISISDFVTAPMGETIVGLFFINAFFVLAFESDTFHDHILPGLRRKFDKRRSRLGLGLLLGGANFVDDLATGGVLNRLFKSDITSPGVNPALRRQMLLMVLLLANAFAAIVPISVWAVLYQEQVVGDAWRWSWFAWAIFPLTLISFIIFLILFSPPRTDGRIKSVLGFDFLREPPPKESPIPPPIMYGLMLGPLLVTIILLPLTNVIIAFAVGILLQLIGISLIAWHEHFKGPIASPFLKADSCMDGERSVEETRAQLSSTRLDFAKPLKASSNPVSGYREDADLLARLDSAIAHTSAAKYSLQNTDAVRTRIHPNMRTKTPAFLRIDALWRRRLDGPLHASIKNMAGDLSRVYMILVVAGAVKVCIGLPLTAHSENERETSAIQHNVESMLVHSSPFFHADSRSASGTHASAATEESESGNDEERIFSKPLVVLVMIGTVLLLFSMHFLHLSSAWGVIAIAYPVVTAALPTEVLNQDHNLLLPMFFGLILSFGIWCNSTLETGDNVEIASGVQGIPSRKLAKLSSYYCRWPLFFCSLTFIFAILFEPFLRDCRSVTEFWLPIVLAIGFGFGTYLINRNALFSHVDEISN